MHISTLVLFVKFYIFLLIFFKIKNDFELKTMSLYQLEQFALGSGQVHSGKKQYFRRYA